MRVGRVAPTVATGASAATAVGMAVEATVAEKEAARVRAEATAVPVVEMA